MILPTHLIVCFIIIVLHIICTIWLNYLVKKGKINKQFHTDAGIFWILFIFLATKNFIEQN